MAPPQPTIDFRSAMTEAVGFHRSGRFAEAAARYRAVLEAFPGQPDPLHLLGLALHRLGDPRQAELMVERAVAIAPQHPGYRASQGNLLLGARRFAEAERAFRAGLAAAAQDPECRHGLAIALREQGQVGEAEQQLRALCAEQPRFVPAFDNLAALLLETGRAAEAEALARQALALAPDDPLAHHNLGSALYQQRKAAEAEAPLRQALKLKPDHIEAKYNLGLVYNALRRQAEADPLLRACVKHDSRSVHYLVALSETVRELSLGDEAYALAQRAYELDPASPEVMACYAAALREHNEHGAAADLLKEALVKMPNPAGWSMLAALYWEMGRHDEARAAAEQALALDPMEVGARVVMANAARVRSLDDPNLKALEALKARPELTEEDRTNLCFGLGKAYDDCGEHARAFAAYDEGNHRRKALLPPFDPAADLRNAEGFIRVFTPATIARLAAHGASSAVPVFVVGMPRSGTSLAEQIMASHPDAYGAGELLKMREIVARISGRSLDRGGPDIPDAFAALQPADVGEFARLYLDHLYGAAGEAKLRIVDKMPLNFRNIGIIAMLFPHAHIVHCTRAPMDNCLSMYFQNFGRGNTFSYDLDHLGAFFATYRRLMAHWHAVLPGRILDLPYEGVVADPERWSRALIAHIGLPWDPRCLDFHETERTVRTASAWQVKQPIYKRSVARWKRYEQELQPLKRALEAHGIEVEQ
jgi:tetratricopeptide (TPR) repeat protein